MATIKEWQKKAYEQSAASGFHEDDSRCSERDLLGKDLMNLGSEISELWEAFRDGKLHRHCQPNMIGGCLVHDDKDINRETGVCATGAREREHDLCDKAEKMRALGTEPLTCGEEEMADLFLRLCDVSKRLGIDLERAAEIKHAYNKSRPRKHGGKLA